jgi:ADP-ribose pyrophosphatase YjhB (NUDIX family)
MKKITYKIKIIKSAKQIPSRDNVSAVFLVAFSNNKVLAIRNERGWDIPGGHLKNNETLLEGLERETLEEAGARFKNAEAFAVLSLKNSNNVMLFFTAPSYNLETFILSEDALERELLSIDELLRRYYGDKKILGAILQEAQNRI